MLLRSFVILYSYAVNMLLSNEMTPCVLVLLCMAQDLNHVTTYMNYHVNVYILWLPCLHNNMHSSNMVKSTFFVKQMTYQILQIHAKFSTEKDNYSFSVLTPLDS